MIKWLKNIIYRRYPTITLYGLNNSCGGGCYVETIVFKTLEETEMQAIRQRKYGARIKEMEGCIDLGDFRYVYGDRVLRLGSNEIDVEGKILMFYDV